MVPQTWRTETCSILADANRAEETGIQITGGRLVDMLYPDSGLLASKVGVMSADLSEEQRALPNDCEVDEVEWFTLQDLGNIVATGTLRDGI